MQIGVTDRDILRATQGAVPMEHRGNMVLIEFLEPIDKRFATDFYRIGLTEVHLQKGENDQGEDSFYHAEIFQPSRVGPKSCSRCRGINFQRSLTVSVCRNVKCPLHGRPIADGPVRGVVNVTVPADYVVKVEMIPAKTRKGKVVGMLERTLTRGALLVLDRRYPESVLAAVWRTAKQLGEIRGWKIKG